MATDAQFIIQKKREILMHINTLSNIVHAWTGNQIQYNQLTKTTQEIAKRFGELSNITNDKHEADAARERAYKLSTFQKNVPKSISKDDLELQIYHIFGQSILYTTSSTVNSKLGFGLTADQLRAA